MLDLKRIREDTQFVRDRLSRRGKTEALDNVDQVLALVTSAWNGRSHNTPSGTTTSEVMPPSAVL